MSGEIFDIGKFRGAAKAPLSARAALERYHELITCDKSKSEEEVRQVRLALADKIRRATAKYGAKPE